MEEFAKHFLQLGGRFQGDMYCKILNEVLIIMTFWLVPFNGSYT